MGSATSIWPTSASATKRADPLRRGDRVVVLDRRGRHEQTATVTSTGPHFVEVPSPTRAGSMWLVDPKRVVPLRTYAIGEGLVRARQRMERALAWLREQGACADSIVFASAYRSPEAAVMALAEQGSSYLCWLHDYVLGDCATCPFCDEDAVRVARWLIASPEWASLPWQRDPGVDRG
jgi:hypothetical protein